MNSTHIAQPGTPKTSHKEVNAAIEEEEEEDDSPSKLH